MATHQKAFTKLVTSLVDSDFRKGFQWGQEASQDEQGEGPISEQDILACIREEIDPATFRRDALLATHLGTKPLSLSCKYGFIAGYILATYTDADAFLIEPDRPVLTLVANH